MHRQYPVARYSWTSIVLTSIFGGLVLLLCYANNINAQFVGLVLGQDLPHSVYGYAPFSWPGGEGLQQIRACSRLLLPKDS